MATDSTKQFIESNSKWVRVLAGPGAGKTFSLKKRIERLVNTLGVKQEKILVLTFTSIAAQDLCKSVHEELGMHSLKVSTLHSLALEILERWNEPVRILTNFEKDTALRDLDPSVGLVKEKTTMLKGRLAGNGTSSTNDDTIWFEKSLTAWKTKYHTLFLDELIPHVCNYLKGNPVVRDSSSFDWIIVDEYQDLNPDEQLFVELLLSKDGRLAVVGDDDQSIYEFKGADPTGIKNFVKTHAGCEDIQFAKCWRCPTAIVNYANTLIEKNTGRIDKKLETHSAFQEGKCELLESLTPTEELDNVVKMVNEEITNGLNPNDIVVLAPRKDRGRKLYKAMTAAGIPTAFCFRDAIFDSAKVRENYSLLSLAANHNDLVSLRYLLGCGSKERKARSYRYIRKFADSKNMAIMDVLEQCAAGKIRVEYQYTKGLIQRYKDIRDQLNEINARPQWLIENIKATDTQYTSKQYTSLLERAFSEKFSIGGIKEVHRMVIDELFSQESTAANNQVRIMSLHASKGLSAPLVIIMSAVEDLIPFRDKPIEEQRRLFYVAITRCKGGEKGKYAGKVIISWYTHSESLGTQNKLTRFISEMGL